MKNILVVKANNRPDGVSAKMFDTFVENLDTNNVDVVTFDVYAQPMPYIGQTLFEAFGKLSQTRIKPRRTRIDDCPSRRDEQIRSSRYHRFRFPNVEPNDSSSLHTFIDYIFQAGFTFSYNEDGSMNQLLKDKEIVLLNARGGVYSGEMSAMENAVTFMEKVFGGMFGMNITEEVIIEGHNADPSKTSRNHCCLKV